MILWVSVWAVDDCPGTLGDFGVLHWQVIGGDLNFAFSCDGHQRSETGWQIGQNLDRTIICKLVEFYTGNFYSSKRSHPARKNNWFVVVAVFWAVDHDLKQMGQRGSVLNGDMCSTPSSCLKGYWTFLDIGVVGVVGVDFRKCMQWGGWGRNKNVGTFSDFISWNFHCPIVLTPTISLCIVRALCRNWLGPNFCDCRGNSFYT
jgi:hypothetical protein